MLTILVSKSANGGHCICFTEPGKAAFVRLGDTVSNNQPLLIIINESNEYY